MLAVSNVSGAATSSKANVRVDVFPGLSEAINDVDVERAMKWAKIIKERIEAATKTLSI